MTVERRRSDALCPEPRSAARRGTERVVMTAGKSEQSAHGDAAAVAERTHGSIVGA